MSIVIIVLYFLLPAIFLHLGNKFPIIHKISIVVLCYAAGLILGNIHIIPDSINSTQGTLMGLTILLGIPLVLFSENVLKWAKMARTTFISLLLGVASVVVLVFIGYFLFRNSIPEIWKISGMMIGVYTGGTPNLAAIAQGLNVPEELYIMTHSAELIIGAVVLLFLLTGAKPFFGIWLKPYHEGGNNSEPDIDVSDFESFEGFFQRDNVIPILKSLGLGILFLAIGYGLTFFFEGETKDTVAVLAVTTLGLGASLIPSVNRIKSSFQLGMYFIYVFCMIVASKADLVALFSVENVELLTSLLSYIALVVFGSFLLHALLSKIFGINVDEFIITSTALSNSPPFVPVVAAAIRNKEVVVPGMVIGVIGYAIGNYLGVAVAYLLQ
jgi:uncharacterized membrane protein